ncbi:MAG: prepilin-type N-terminal cleavage/methylation domain-containing protein [Acidobacteriota bacterium]|nr:prepilin-type N-terminal cleavage/methylation domain-containing protein [Acidobacteriota bacterium]
MTRGSSQGRSSQSGVTLIEMLIVMAIIGVIAGISFPSVMSGLEGIQLRSAADSITGFLSGAMTRVDRHEQAIEVVISPADSSLTLYSSEPGYTRKLELENGIRIAGDQPRQFLLLPGGTPPEMGIDIYNRRGVHKMIRIDPVTGVPRS